MPVDTLLPDLVKGPRDLLVYAALSLSLANASLAARLARCPPAPADAS